MNITNHNERRRAACNSRFAQAGFSGDVTLGSSLVFGVHLIDLFFIIPACAKRQNVISHFKATETNDLT
jgi:hypothetical protein